MLFDLSKQVCDELGSPQFRIQNEEIVDKISGEKTVIQVKKPATFKELLATPLFMEYPEDTKLAYKDKLKRSRLAYRVINHDDKEPINFDIDEIKMMKEYCGKSLKVVYISQLEDFFENSVGPSPDAKQYMDEKAAEKEKATRDKTMTPFERASEAVAEKAKNSVQ